MPSGYMGQVLRIDLADGSSRAEELPAGDARELVGGYGIGAKFLWLNQPGGVDPLGPDNWLGFTTGPLTGSSVPTGTRWIVVTKSPLTGTWGDANAGGRFGQQLRAAGFDAVYFRGISERPVYAVIDEGVPSLHDAAELWGKDAFETEARLKEDYGAGAAVACIGQAGENRSLISGIVHSEGRVAGRSGVGAVMGAKRLKALVVRGTCPLLLSDPDAVRAVKKKYVGQITSGVGAAAEFRAAGTMSDFEECVFIGDTPVHNWAGEEADFPEVARVGRHALFAGGRKKRTCWACPIACWGEVHHDGELAPQAEYETVAAFGPLQLVSDLKAILKSNELCNRYGLDTISAGSTIAFAMECFAQGIITERDVGFPLRWGDGAAATRLVEEMAHRRGFGDVLADGSLYAAERLGPAARPLAMQIMGQDLPMHDPRLEPGLGLVYLVDATPGRHTQGLVYATPPEWDRYFPNFGVDFREQTDRGRMMKPLGNFCHALQAAGACLFGAFSTAVDFLPESLSAVTAVPYSIGDVLLCGERIANLRQAFNVREGLNPLEFEIPARAYGRPPLESGPHSGFQVRVEAMLQEYLEEMDWSRTAAVPSAAKLSELGLDFVLEDPAFQAHRSG
jgi:aldehyde:ferredoxin oxidoreductase